MTLGKKILVGFILCGAVLFGVAIYTFNNSERFVESNEWVEHTQEVINEFSELKIRVVDAETGGRGYIITGNETFLEPYVSARANIYDHLFRLRELTVDNVAQKDRIDQLENKIEDHLAYLEQLIAIRKQDPQKAYAIVSSGKGKMITDGIRLIIDEAKESEQALLAERKKQSEEEAANFNLVFAILLMVIVTVLAFVYYIIIINLRALRKAEKETGDKNWLLAGNSQVNDAMTGEKDAKMLARDLVSKLAGYMNAQIGAIYLAENELLTFAGSYAYDAQADNETIKFGHGLLGQAALESKAISLKNVPADYLRINSGLGNSTLQSLLIFPFQYAGKVKGVIELGALHEFSELDQQLLEMVAENIGIAFNSSQSRSKLKELLEETQVQSEELQAQQEELRQMNEELEEQSQNLRQQQEELQVTNEELEEQTQSLEMKNKEVESAKQDIEQKTRQLEISSKYKSEFLANMSHELRTPLNSLLILSKDLSENKAKNLTDEQVESAEVIYKSGRDLLSLINEVLDLSKIEAGKMDVNIEAVSIQKMLDELQRDFKHQTDQKGLKFITTATDNLPEYIRTDAQRLNQVLKNLLSNAIKFTEHGSVTLSIERYLADALKISVADTGIGIPEDKQMAIFEAFQQADGGTSRKYGGTGLGLSISRELAKLLGAEIHLTSTPNQGSVFSLIIPVELKEDTEISSKVVKHEASKQKVTQSSALFLNFPALEDDRDNIGLNDKVVLIIEDDLQFAAILMRQAAQKGFKRLSAATGEDGLLLASRYKPSAIILDIDLPGMNGNAVLLALKENPEVRHIPVHIMSVNERSLDPIKEGAIEYLVKPVEKNELVEAFNRIENFVNRRMKNLLIVEDDVNSRLAMRKLIGNGDVKCFEAGSGKEALDIYGSQHIDCMVLDIGLPDMSGFDLIYKLNKFPGKNIPPIIIYTGRDLSKQENEELQKYAGSIIIKGVRSEERLLDETALFLHRTISNLPESKQQIIQNLHDKEIIFQGKKILLADDDMRNIFALSKILKERGMQIVKADNGKNALDMLEKNPDIDLVLMDIMMPEMDGYEAMRRIREQEKYRQLPVIALTAKAMKDDKQKCIDAGANDYITKPVDVERLLSLMRVWLSK